MVIDSRTPNTGCYRYLHSEEQTVHPFAVFFRPAMCRNSPFKDQSPEPHSKYLRVSHKTDPTNYESLLPQWTGKKQSMPTTFHLFLKEQCRRFPFVLAHILLLLLRHPSLRETVLVASFFFFFFFLLYSILFCNKELWPSVYPSPSCCSFSSYILPFAHSGTVSQSHFI